MWSDDFDDGDYDGWIIAEGVFLVNDNVLDPVIEGASNTAYRSSIVATGTWSFDLYFTAFGGGTVIFMWTWENYGYYLSMTTASLMDLYRTAGEAADVRLSLYYFPSSLSGWQHFDITRDQNGRICVYHNGAMVMDTVDLTVSTSQIFAYSAARSGQAIDNIVVSNTIDVLPPPLQLWQQWWFWATILAVVIMVTAIAFFRLRRKRN